MNVQKEARRDAREYARAQMFYGEGAGTRRKLIVNSVMAKEARNPTYARAFDAALAKEDMAEHAAKARRERERKDATRVVDKNARGLLTGNYQSVNSSVLLVAGVAYLAHKTGYDKKIYAAGQRKYSDLRSKYIIRKAKRNNPGVWNVTNLSN